MTNDLADPWEDQTTAATEPLEAAPEFSPPGFEKLSLATSVETMLRQREKGVQVAYEIALTVDSATKGKSDPVLVEADKQELKRLLYEQVDEQIILSYQKQIQEKLAEYPDLTPREAALLLKVFRATLELVLMNDPEINAADHFSFTVAALVKTVSDLTDARR